MTQETLNDIKGFVYEKCHSSDFVFVDYCGNVSQLFRDVGNSLGSNKTAVVGDRLPDPSTGAADSEGILETSKCATCILACKGSCACSILHRDYASPGRPLLRDGADGSVPDPAPEPRFFVNYFEDANT